MLLCSGIVRRRTRRFPLSDKTLEYTKSSLNPQGRENNWEKTSFWIIINEKLIFLDGYKQFSSQFSSLIFSGFFAFPSKALWTPCWIRRSLQKTWVISTLYFNYYLKTFDNSIDFLRNEAKINKSVSTVS